jgi:hypothetical protein
MEQSKQQNAAPHQRSFIPLIKKESEIKMNPLTNLAANFVAFGEELKTLEKQYTRRTIFVCVVLGFAFLCFHYFSSIYSSIVVSDKTTALAELNQQRVMALDASRLLLQVKTSEDEPVLQELSLRQLRKTVLALEDESIETYLMLSDMPSQEKNEIISFRKSFVAKLSPVLKGSYTDAQLADAIRFLNNHLDNVLIAFQNAQRHHESTSKAGTFFGRYNGMMLFIFVSFLIVFFQSAPLRPLIRISRSYGNLHADFMESIKSHSLLTKAENEATTFDTKI